MDITYTQDKRTSFAFVTVQVTNHIRDTLRKKKTNTHLFAGILWHSTKVVQRLLICE